MNLWQRIKAWFAAPDPEPPESVPAVDESVRAISDETAAFLAGETGPLPKDKP